MGTLFTIQHTVDKGMFSDKALRKNDVVADFIGWQYRILSYQDLVSRQIDGLSLVENRCKDRESAG